MTVWSPRHAAGTALPVMVWIPGGAFVYGAGQLQLYNGSRLAANGNVVVVNVTYRLGVFGGFELVRLGAGFDDNLCLRDQIAALRWVADNIAAFGGDPSGSRCSENPPARRRCWRCWPARRRGPVRPGDRPEPRAAADRRPGDPGATCGRVLPPLGVGPAQLPKALPQRSLRRRAAGAAATPQCRPATDAGYGLTHGVELLPHASGRGGPRRAR